MGITAILNAKILLLTNPSRIYREPKNIIYIIKFDNINLGSLLISNELNTKLPNVQKLNKIPPTWDKNNTNQVSILEKERRENNVNPNNVFKIPILKYFKNRFGKSLVIFFKKLIFFLSWNNHISNIQTYFKFT